MTYTINGKEWTEFDINKRCAELMGVDYSIHSQVNALAYTDELGEVLWYRPCNNPADTDAIIDKCFHKLVEYDHHNDEVEWEDIMDRYNCTKLVAACICFIEINEAV
jgi:hypothetical protein